MTDQEYFDLAVESLAQEVKAMANHRPICPECQVEVASILVKGTLLEPSIEAMCPVHGVIKPIGVME